jgi:hypothetical protein
MGGTNSIPLFALTIKVNSGSISPLFDCHLASNRRCCIEWRNERITVQKARWYLDSKSGAVNIGGYVNDHGFFNLREISGLEKHGRSLKKSMIQSEIRGF